MSAFLNPGACGARCQGASLLKRSLWAVKTRGDSRGSELRLERGEVRKHGRGAPSTGAGAFRPRTANKPTECAGVHRDQGEACWLFSFTPAPKAAPEPGEMLQACL